MKRIKQAICSNETIRELLTSEEKLKNHLKAAIPIVLGFISTSLSLGPIGLVLAIGAIAILIKIGYQKYCKIA